MTQTAKQKFPYGGGWLIREDESVDFDRVSAKIDNSANSADVVIPAGHPFKSLTSGTAASMLSSAADIANNTVTVGALIEPVTIRAGEIRSVAVAAKGLNVFNATQLPTADYLGAALGATGLAAGSIGNRYVTDLKWSGRVDPSGPTAAPPTGGSNVATGGEQVT